MDSDSLRPADAPCGSYMYDIASHFLHHMCWNKKIWWQNARMIWSMDCFANKLCFNSAFSPYHLPSVHSSLCLSSINECNQPPHPHQPPTTPGLPVSHSEPATAIPQGPLHLLTFVKHSQWLAQLAAALTTAPVRRAGLSVWTLWTAYIVKHSTVCF